MSKFVIEGAPGQGKSTVTQFICQVNRLRLLRRDSELRRLDELHKTALARIPFRIDLRDYAAWVSRERDHESDSEAMLSYGHTSLESFLAAHVTKRSGGLNITAHELVQFLSESHSILVLDGFDEVADIPTRKQIVQEICEAVNRLDYHAKSHADYRNESPGGVCQLSGLSRR